MESSILDPRGPRPEFSGSTRWRYAPALWIAGAALLAYSITIAWTGGIDVTLAGIRLRSRTWQRPATLALLCLATVAVVDRRHAWRRAVHGALRLWRGWAVLVAAISPRAITTVAAAWTLAAGLAFGTFIAGGADSSGYLNQARVFARGRAVDESRVERPPWREAGYKLAPLGYRPAADRSNLAPTYPPGYPLLMAPGFLIDAKLPFLIVPLSGVVAVTMTFMIGRRAGLPAAGASAALLLSVSPTFLYQLIQPMSDVPVTAAWLLSLYLARGERMSTAALSGVAAGAAILIRPNLLPLAAFTCGACALSPAGTRWRRSLVPIVPIVIATALLGAIQSARYGSPFGSGYGPFHDLFAWAHLWPNLERYPRWMFETHTPLIGLFVVAPVWLMRDRGHRIFLLLLWAFAIAVVAAYLPYVYFQTFEWTYTRFLLPAIPIMWLLVAAPLDLLAKRLRQPTRAVLFVPLVVLVSAFCVYVATTRSLFELRFGERKYTETAAYVREVLPPNALLICMQHSGSLWFYTARPIVRWDYMDGRELREMLAWADDRGYVPFLIADREEYDRLTERFQRRAQDALERLQPRARFGDATIYAFE